MYEPQTHKEKRGLVFVIVIVAPIAGFIFGGLSSLVCSNIFAYLQVGGRSTDVWFELMLPAFGGAITSGSIQAQLKNEKIDAECDFWYVAAAYGGSILAFVLITAKYLGFWS